MCVSLNCIFCSENRELSSSYTMIQLHKQICFVGIQEFSQERERDTIQKITVFHVDVKEKLSANNTLHNLIYKFLL